MLTGGTRTASALQMHAVSESNNDYAGVEGPLQALRRDCGGEAHGSGGRELQPGEAWQAPIPRINTHVHTQGSVLLVSCAEQLSRVQGGPFRSLCVHVQDDIVREAQTMRRLHHPNVLLLHVSFVHKQTLWMVEPYIAGGSMLNIMKYAYPEASSCEPKSVCKHMAACMSCVCNSQSRRSKAHIQQAVPSAGPGGASHSCHPAGSAERAGLHAQKRQYSP